MQYIMLARCNVGLLESIFFHELEEYPVVHIKKVSGGPLNTDNAVYMFRF